MVPPWDTKIRLYVEQPLGEGQTIPLTRDQAHYLFGVMRRGTGDAVSFSTGGTANGAPTVRRGGQARRDTSR